MNIKEKLSKQLLFFDGGMGTMLQRLGMKGGEIPELINLTNPEMICKIHKEYINAGANIITTNTFGANPLKSEELGENIDKIIKAAIDNVKKAASECDKDILIAFDMGPTGKLLEPLGSLSFDDAYESFKQIAIVAEESGADLVIIETMSDTLEAKAAILAVKENTNLPIFATMTFDESGKALTGATPVIMCAMFEGLGVDCIGINCGLGPKAIYPMMKTLAGVSSTPIMAQPNAGLPKIVDGKTTYDVTPEIFAAECECIARLGASVLGGCCGTTPEHIKKLVEVCKNYEPVVTKKDHTIVCSYSKAVFLGNKPVIVGERINPTGKKKFKEALCKGDIDYILNEAFAQEEAGAHILDVNVGLPEIDECATMEKVVKAVSSSVNLPLQIDSSDPQTIERALRIYNGKPMINSVNGKAESMNKILPVVKKYGGVLVGLCLDENGIPQTAEGRVEIARKITNEAQKYGIDKKELVMDALTLTISAQQQESAQTIKALRIIKEDLGIKTVLGVSNISFGLPRRELINSTFFALALNNGLDACIINPCAESMMNTYRSYLALTGYDENCVSYIVKYANTKAQTTIISTQTEDTEKDSENALFNIIVKGLKDQSYSETQNMLKTHEPMHIINNTLIKALDVVGKGFESGRMFLPQLMMSAQTVKNSFDAIKEYISKSGTPTQSKGKIVIATVKGDIHDIGKNIVKVLLENYGYTVIDLGKDVAPEVIVEALKKEDVHLCGLSALMTTTVVSMEDTIKAIQKEKLDVKVFVGGAVLNKEYAQMIGADKYCSDALGAVAYANEFFGN